MNEKKVTKQTFSVEDWLSDPDLKDWVRKDKNNKATFLLLQRNQKIA